MQLQITLLSDSDLRDAVRSAKAAGNKCVQLKYQDMSASTRPTLSQAKTSKTRTAGLLIAVSAIAAVSFVAMRHFNR